PVAVTHIDRPRQTDHRHPRFLPDGRHFLFYVIGVPEAAGIYLGSLDGGEPKRLAASATHAEFFAPDSITFVRGTTLMVQRLDLKGGELVGDPVRLADPVGSNGVSHGAFSVSPDGRVAYRSGGGSVRQLKWR